MKPSFIAIGIFFLLLSCSGNKTETNATQQDSLSATSTGPDNQNVQAPVSEEPVDTTGFNDFIKLFRTPETELTDVALSFVGQQDGYQYSTVALLDTEPVYLLLYKRSDQGSGTGSLNGVSFAKDGTTISNVELAEYSYAREPYGEAKSYEYTYKNDRKTIFVSRHERRWDENKQEGFSIESLNPFYLDENGNVEAGRNYLSVSEEFLELAGLRDIPKDELKIMRNEVFAVYGYIFKTEPLKSHFEAKSWYKGERENVDDMLTDIEKKNIALIKQVENSK